MSHRLLRRTLALSLHRDTCFFATHGLQHILQRNSTRERSSRSNCFHFRSPGFFIPPFLSWTARPLSLSMQIFTPERGIKRGGERHPLISGTVGRSRFSIADSTRQPTDDGGGGERKVSACISVFPPPPCCWLYELKRGILMSGGGRIRERVGGGMISPANIDPFSRRGKRKRRGNRDSFISALSRFEKFADPIRRFWARGLTFHAVEFSAPKTRPRPRN